MRHEHTECGVLGTIERIHSIELLFTIFEAQLTGWFVLWILNIRVFFFTVGTVVKLLAVVQHTRRGIHVKVKDTVLRANCILLRQ